MFGKNPVLKPSKGDGKQLSLVDGRVFQTIQGEGPYSGRRAIFIRLHGCNLACTFCDTEFSNPNDPVVTIDEIVKQCLDYGKNNLIVITGGEPFRQNIAPLIDLLRVHGYYRIQIETAGTLDIPTIDAEIVVSPKTPTISERAYNLASAFKYVISASNAHDGFIPITATQRGARAARLAAPRLGARVYLSPMDEYDAEKNAANIKLVGELAMKYNCIAGVQLHKILDLP